VEGQIPLELTGLSNLVGLYLAVNKLEGTVPKELGKLKSLEEL
jgi:Leucine-rich repeat (LRR) protein